MSEKATGTDEGILVVKGEDVAKVAMALSSQTRIQILNFIKEKDVDMQEVAELIKQSKANASAQMRILEEAGLVKTSYKPGVRGVKKVCSTNVKEVRLILV
jgi:predicted transcriptional regulator